MSKVCNGPNILGWGGQLNGVSSMDLLFTLQRVSVSDIPHMLGHLVLQKEDTRNRGQAGTYKLYTCSVVVVRT